MRRGVSVHPLCYSVYMRSAVSTDRLRQLIQQLGRRASSSGNVYFVGGSTALLLGFRQQTIDVDLKIDPEPAGIFEAISEIKTTLDINIELASPDDFIPALPEWRERSRFIERAGLVDFYHYDFYGQALAKIERGFEQDLADVRSFFEHDLVKPDELLRCFEAIQSELIRYPAIDPSSFRRKVESVLMSLGDEDE